MQHPRYQTLFLACDEELRPLQADTLAEDTNGEAFCAGHLKDLTETRNRKNVFQIKLKLYELEYSGIVVVCYVTVIFLLRVRSIDSIPK